MKHFKFPLFLLAMGIAIAGAFAFSPKAEKAQPFSTSYHYIGAYTDPEVKKPINWVEESSSCPESGDVPCSILTDLNRANFDLMVQGFADVADATSAATTRTEQ